MQCGILYILSAVVVLHVGVHNYLEFSIVQKESVAVMLLQLARLTNSLIFFLFFFTKFQIFIILFQIQVTDWQSKLLHSNKEVWQQHEWICGKLHIRQVYSWPINSIGFNSYPIYLVLCGFFSLRKKIRFLGYKILFYASVDVKWKSRNSAGNIGFWLDD